MTMLKIKKLEHQFVETIPEVLDPGVLYVSMEFGTATHQCCCGCGEEVVTPFTPTDWKLTYDGETVSLWPSIGNWNLACRSHYVIRGGKVFEAGPWSDERIGAERVRDRAAKAIYYGTPAEVNGRPPAADVQPGKVASDGLAGRIGKWIKHLWS